MYFHIHLRQNKCLLARKFVLVWVLVRQAGIYPPLYIYISYMWYIYTQRCHSLKIQGGGGGYIYIKAVKILAIYIYTPNLKQIYSARLSDFANLCAIWSKIRFTKFSIWIINFMRSETKYVIMQICNTSFKKQWGSP